MHGGPGGREGLKSVVAAHGDDVASRLERLAALHRAGQLSDDEYEAAKRAVIEGR
jgi:hypothetical protein